MSLCMTVCVCMCRINKSQSNFSSAKNQNHLLSHLFAVSLFYTSPVHSLPQNTMQIIHRQLPGATVPMPALRHNMKTSEASLRELV